MSVLGVNLSSSPLKPSKVAVLNKSSSLSYFGLFAADEELVELAKSLRPKIISIGTPLSLPMGLCCLEPAHSCNLSVPNRKGRLLEMELARMRISCFFTNKGSIVRSLIYRGIELKSKLRQAGFEVIEAYPHASKIILFGDKIPSTRSAAGLAILKERLGPLIGCLASYAAEMDRNGCDAALNAYTGLLHIHDETDVLGCEEEGTLVLPKLPN